MSELGSFADLANVKSSEVKAPVPHPIGHYVCIIAGLMKPHKAKSGNQAMRFPVKVLEAGSDVDAAALEEFLAAGGTLEKDITIDFWMSPDARFRYTEFCAAMDLTKGDPNLLELAERLATSNKPFTLECKHEPAKDASGNDDPSKPPYTRWDNPAPIAG